MACQLQFGIQNRRFDKRKQLVRDPAGDLQYQKGTKMIRPTLVAMILLGLLCLGCGDEDTPSTAPSVTPIDAIVNASSQANHTSYWHVDIGAGTSDWAFFTDGTGRYEHTRLAPQGVDFTWTRLGADALLIDIAIQTFKNMSSISGSIGKGTFTALLDGNPTARTFVLTAGQL
jgi:hypothetical protein